MTKFAGKWKMESGENFEEYMKALGVGMVMRKMAGAAKPLVEISIDGDTWVLKTSTTFKTTEITFKLGEKFEEITGDGRKVQTTITLEGDTKLVQNQEADVPSVLTREMTDDNTFNMTMVAKGITSTRLYKREQ